jgi:two-component system sensor histidine kinase DesK
MLLRGRARTAGCAALAVLMLAMFYTFTLSDFPPDGAVAAWVVYYSLYFLVNLVTPAVLFGATRLVSTLEELLATRKELTALAVARERLRLSRDLHDVLGQNLSAVSLQGDLALRLLPKHPHAARTEIEKLTRLARDTLQGMRAVTHDEHRVSLRTELDGASALLATAGIAVTVQTHDGGLSVGGQEVFAWTIREGVTNILRHSAARNCSITTQRHDGLVRLVIRNDGAHTAVTDDGTGLRGLTARSAAQGGSARGVRLDADTFELIVELPAETLPEGTP